MDEVGRGNSELITSALVRVGVAWPQSSGRSYLYGSTTNGTWRKDHPAVQINRVAFVRGSGCQSFPFTSSTTSSAFRPGMMAPNLSTSSGANPSRASHFRPPVVKRFA
jgi:hypothetical protein